MAGSRPSRAGTRFLTIFEVAAIIRVSKRTVYRPVHDGQLEDNQGQGILPHSRSRGNRPADILSSP